MPVVSIDIETYSSVDLKTSGVYKYIESPDFTILMLAYAVDNGEVQIVDFASGECLTDELSNFFEYPELCTFTAHNASFERLCINRFYMLDIPASSWSCNMVKCAMLGLPMALEQVAKVLRLPEQKDTEGKALIRYFCLPCKPTKANGLRTRNLPEHAPEKWQKFLSYCKQDVETERAIRNKIAFFEIPDTEIALYNLDQKINDTGVLLDPVLINNALYIDTNYRERLKAEAIEITGLANPNSAAQLKKWIADETDTAVDGLKKDDVLQLLKDVDNETVERMLYIRQEMSKTSVKKYVAMTKTLCADERVRGLLQFYGAGRTGRWAGRLIQVQNLPRIELKDLDLARTLVRKNDAEGLELLFGNVPDTLSQLIRTAFIASPGCRLIVSDFSAIEARVIAWLAGEKWRLEVFNTHGKIYEASAAQMFKVPIESITKGNPLRQKGKISELALGYQGGPGALEKMGALKMGLTEDELQPLVTAWRNANPAIVRLWADMGAAAIDAVENGERVLLHHGVAFFVQKGVLFMELPSGRRLSYMCPKLKTGKFGGMALTYQGMDQTTKQWCTLDTYGGKLVENCVQAIARDCLADAMLRLDAAGYKIVMHVHDEVVLEVLDNAGTLAEVDEIMSAEIMWAKGLPLTAEGFETSYYKKD